MSFWKGCKTKCVSASTEHQCIGKHPPTQVFKYLQNRQYGSQRNQQTPVPEKIVYDFVTQQIPGLLEEKEYKMGKINKIFSAKWLNNNQIAIGTKCNKLLILDVNTGRILNIPSLKSSDKSYPSECPCGIHSIDINPSRTLLATGAENTNDLAVYKLPTFDPVMVGEGGHSDWIFDMKWLDDEFIVTASRDSKLSLWKVDEVENSDISGMLSLQIPEYSIKKPEISKLCDKAQKCRALSYNDEREELAVLSLNSYFHIWDIETFSSKQCRKLPHTRENVCMTCCKDKVLYAVGSQSHINLVDPRSPNTLTTVISRYRGGGIRSLSFKEDVLTIGTGVGHVLFFDIKAGKYFDCNCGHACTLNVGHGWLLHDENYREYFMDNNYPNAIYTHEYDLSGTRLFTAGGPLPAGLWGNYAGLWW